MQVAENDRVEAKTDPDKPLIRYYACALGAFKTAFTRYRSYGRDPEVGAKVVVRLAEDDSHKYHGGSYWEFDKGEMRQVPW